MNIQNLEEFMKVIEKLQRNEKTLLPLCAAENITSDFVKLPMNSFLQEKYLLGSVLQYSPQANFCGSDLLFDIYNLLHEECKKLFNCEFADARTLSGLNAVITLIMSLFNIGDYLLITSPEHGGHSSMPLICERLGINFDYLPYDYKNNDFDYEKVNTFIKEKKPNGILIALSDMIKHPQLNKLILNDTILIYDATQILGLIATKMIDNPFDWFESTQKFILLGATHKTIPGPTCGLILTNNVELAKKIDLKINPNFLRNTQLNNIASLLLALYELENFGKKYFSHMYSLIEFLGKALEKKGFAVCRANPNYYSRTHQLWFVLSEKEVDIFEKNALLANISINVRRNNNIYQNCGVRLGIQQIARFGWNNEVCDIIANIFSHLRKRTLDYKKIKKLLDKLPPKIIKYTYDSRIFDNMQKLLHNKDSY